MSQKRPHDHQVPNKYDDSKKSKLPSGSSTLDYNLPESLLRPPTPPNPPPPRIGPLPPPPLNFPPTVKPLVTGPPSKPIAAFSGSKIRPLGKPAGKNISIQLGAVKKPTPVANALLQNRSSKVAELFNPDSSDEEEMPPEAKMKMRNIGRETITSAGPNSFGKTKQGFCDDKKLFEKKLKDAMDNVCGD